MSLYDGGPWDKKEKTAGAHVFNRKLLYGSEHDSAEHLDANEDRASYGKAERHKMHDFWVESALKLCAEELQHGRTELRKIATGRGGKLEWPGTLGKHHAIIEELLERRVFTLHQESKDNGQMVARIHAGPLSDAMKKMSARAASGAAAAAAASSEASVALPPLFSAAPSWVGPRPGCVFKNGEQGLGYYRDGAAASSGAGSGGSGPDNAAVASAGPEARAAEPPVTEAVVLGSWQVASMLAADAASIGKMQDDSGASIAVDVAGSCAHATGTPPQVARARQLLERKAKGLAFLVASQQPMPGQKRPAASSLPSAGGGEATRTGMANPLYDFTRVRGFVAEADASRAVLRQRTDSGEAEGAAESGAAAAAAAPAAPNASLAMLADYGDDDDEDDE